VLVYADWTGRSPQEIEDQVTYPLSVNLQGLAGVKTVRANSMFGFSLVTVVFAGQREQLLRPPARERAAQPHQCADARGRHTSSDPTRPGWAGCTGITCTSIRTR
jgi:hypothetical protein